MKKIRIGLVAAALILIGHNTAFAACMIEKKIGNTWLCKGGKALYRGIDENGNRGTWTRLTASKVKVCLPDEQNKFGCRVKKG
jgi:hypothetical protein